MTEPRPIDDIMADIAAAAAELRALRASQAQAGPDEREAITVMIRRVQETLDRLYEEKRLARLAGGRGAGGAAAAATSTALPGRAARIAAQVFADP